MPGCVLRAAGDDFQPEIFLQESTLDPCNVFRKGERKSESRTWNTSGITVVISEGSDFGQQLADAVQFLKSNRAELLRLKAATGLEAMSLDFGVKRRNGFLQSHLFPPELILLAGELSLALEVSIYGSD
jgi:hypothetical protein